MQLLPDTRAIEDEQEVCEFAEKQIKKKLRIVRNFFMIRDLSVIVQIDYFECSDNIKNHLHEKYFFMFSFTYLKIEGVAQSYE